MDSDPSTITCNSCGAPLTHVADKDYLVCSYCGAYFFPKASQDCVKILGEAGTLTCPVCKIPLVTAMIEDMHVQACPRCRGVMINQNELLFIIKSLRLTSKKIDTVLPLNRADLKQERFCQTCGRKLDTHAYEAGGNVVIDVCEHCSTIWFDYGEIKRVISAPDFGIDHNIY